MNTSPMPHPAPSTAETVRQELRESTLGFHRQLQQSKELLRYVEEHICHAEHRGEHALLTRIRRDHARISNHARSNISNYVTGSLLLHALKKAKEQLQEDARASTTVRMTATAWQYLSDEFGDAFETAEALRTVACEKYGIPCAPVHDIIRKARDFIRQVCEDCAADYETFGAGILEKPTSGHGKKTLLID